MGERTHYSSECDNCQPSLIFCQPHLNVWPKVKLTESILWQGTMGNSDVLINRFNEGEKERESDRGGRGVGQRGKINNWVVTLCVQLEMHE